jgi:hypothetical protein
MIIPIPLLLYLIDDAPEDNADGNGGKPPYPDRAHPTTKTIVLTARVKTIPAGWRPKV